MMIYTLALYFSLMFSLVGLLQLLPFARRNLITIVIRSLLIGINIYSILFWTSSVEPLAVILVIVTTLYTEGAEILWRLIFRNRRKALGSAAWMIRLYRILTFNQASQLLLITAKLQSRPDQSDDPETVEVLSEFLQKNRGDLSLAANAIMLLLDLGKPRGAFSLLQSISVDFTRTGIPYSFLQMANKLYCDYSDFVLAGACLEYMENHYYDIQHKSGNITAFLYYYARGGNDGLFMETIKRFPAVIPSGVLDAYQKIMQSVSVENPAPRPMKEYQFNMNFEEKKSLKPLYVFVGMISVVSLLVLLFSPGADLGSRLMNGTIYTFHYIQYGALVGDFVLDGEWIRLITPIFLHAGILHLGLNMLATVNLGRILLRFFNRYVLLFIFLGGAVVGSVFSMFFSDALLSVGASGGVFSLLGAFILYVFWHRKEINPVVFRRLMLNFGIILLIQVVFGLQNYNIDNYAHLGGFIGGILFSALSLWFRARPWDKGYHRTVKVLLIAALASLIAFVPDMVTRSPFDRYLLTQQIAEQGRYFAVPEHWRYRDDRFFDPVSHGQFVFYVSENDLQIDPYLQSVRQQMITNQGRTFLGEVEFENGWRGLHFSVGNMPGDMELHYFARQAPFQMLEVALFLPEGLKEDFYPLVEKILNTVE